MSKNEKIRPIKGVVCDVVSCRFHDGESRCTAPQIEIGPMSATDCTDTVCATYRPLEERIFEGYDGTVSDTVTGKVTGKVTGSVSDTVSG